jgi:hypothetical protein
MTKLQIRAFLSIRLFCDIIHLSTRYLVEHYTELTGYWIPVTAFSLGQVSQALKPRWREVVYEMGFTKGEGKFVVTLYKIKGANYKSFIISSFLYR